MKTSFFDVDTQIDFMFAAGALAVPGAARIVNSLSALTRFASTNGIKILSTADAHSEDDPEFRSWKPHCIAGTVGQQKASATLLSKPVVLSTKPGALDAIAGQLTQAGQIIVEKQHIDCFTNENLRPLLKLLAAERFVVYGVVSEVCVRCALLGLIETGARIELVTDAVQSMNTAMEQETFAQFQAQGGILTTVAAVTG